MKIEISGHGGHFCEAWSGLVYETGYTIEEAIGRLILLRSKELGVEIDLYDCETSAYERSKCFYDMLKKKKQDES